MSSELGDTEPDSGRGFDPFGKPREANWEDVPDTLDDDLNGTDLTTRGFTAHEHLIKIRGAGDGLSSIK